jgi:hypothetical protein
MAPRRKIMSEKISQLTPHTPNAADVIPVADGGANFSDTVGAIESQAAALVVNITGTAVNLSGTPALPNGTTATTQITGDNTTKIATDAFVHASIAALPAETWSGLTGNLTETQVVPFDGPTPGTADTWISRSAAGTVAIGATSTPGDASGTLNLTNIGIAGKSTVTQEYGYTAFTSVNGSLGFLFYGTTIFEDGASVYGSFTLNSGALFAPLLVNPATLTSDNYTAVAGDADQLVTLSDTVACTFTVPTNASVNFPIGTTLTVSQLGMGQITLTPASGAVTINTPSSLTTRAQYSTVSMVQVALNTWVAGGDLT